MHNNNTPEEVLNAPPALVRWVHKHTGLNRKQRRHHYDEKTGKRSFIKAQEETENEQYRKPAIADSE